MWLLVWPTGSCLVWQWLLCEIVVKGHYNSLLCWKTRKRKVMRRDLLWHRVRDFAKDNVKHVHQVHVYIEKSIEKQCSGKPKFLWNDPRRWKQTQYETLWLWCALTCYWAGCWSTWCPCAGSSSCGSNPVLPAAASWKTWCGSRWSAQGLTPAGPSDRGPCTQTPGKTPLWDENKIITPTQWGETRSQRKGHFHAIPLSFLKSKASSLSVTISFMLMMLLWLSCRKILISLMAVIGSPPFRCPNGPSWGPPTQLNKQNQKD